METPKRNRTSGHVVWGPHKATSSRILPGASADNLWADRRRGEHSCPSTRKPCAAPSLRCALNCPLQLRWRSSGFIITWSRSQESIKSMQETQPNPKLQTGAESCKRWSAILLAPTDRAAGWGRVCRQWPAGCLLSLACCGRFLHGSSTMQPRPGGWVPAPGKHSQVSRVPARCCSPAAHYSSAAWP